MRSQIRTWFRSASGHTLSCQSGLGLAAPWLRKAKAWTISCRLRVSLPAASRATSLGTSLQLVALQKSTASCQGSAGG